MPSRHKSRAVALQGLYQKDLVDTNLQDILGFSWYDKPLTQEQKEFAADIICGVIENWDLIDTIIVKYSVRKDISRISIVNRNILRIALYGLKFQKEIPYKIIIDEALEMTREFESENSVMFVNGILDSFVKKELTQDEI